MTTAPSTVASASGPANQPAAPPPLDTPAVDPRTWRLVHSLSNTLTALVANAELLAERGPEGARRHRLAAVLLAASDSVTLLRRWRQHLADSAPCLTPIDLGALVQELYALLKPLAVSFTPPRRVRCAIEPVPTIHGDPVALREALLNLALNALEAMSEGGTLQLRVRAEAHWVVCFVSDTGPGVPAVIAEHLMRSSLSTKGAGHGVGLRIVGDVITAHRGSVSVDTHPGVGTTFVIKLPAAADVRSPSDGHASGSGTA